MILIKRLPVVPRLIINDAQSRVDDERSGHHVPTLLAIMDHSECFTICETLVTATLAFVYLPSSTCTCTCPQLVASMCCRLWTTSCLAGSYILIPRFSSAQVLMLASPSLGSTRIQYFNLIRCYYGCIDARTLSLLRHCCRPRRWNIVHELVPAKINVSKPY